MIASLVQRVAERVRAPIDGARSALAGLPLDGLAELVTSPGQLKQLARLQLSFLDFRYVYPVLLAREAGVYEALGEAPLRVDRLCERCGMHRQAGRTLVRILEAQHLVTIEEDQVSLSPFAQRFLTADSRHSLLPVVDLLRTYMRSFSEVVDSLTTGQTPTALDVQNDNATTDAILDAVNSHLSQVAAEFFERARLPEIDSFIVGSMGVSFSAELLRRQPNARVTYGCLEHLVRRIPRLRGEYEVDPLRVEGMHAHTGEPGDDQWGGEAFDLVFLTRKMILEPELQTGHKFAQKAFEVLEPGGAAVFWEAVHPDQGPSPLALALETVFDLGMSPSAPLKTHRSFDKTLRDIGFTEVDYVSCLGGTTTFAVAHKGG